jgi:prenyltransferase beta subunit
MLQVARLAPRLLSDAAELVVRFLDSQRDPCGGFRNRAGEPDLYYTAFGLEALTALRADAASSATLEYLRAFDAGDSLDLVHLACLARSWANMPKGTLDDERRRRMLENVGRQAACDRAAAPAHVPSAYSRFLEAGAYQDLEAPVPDPHAIAPALDALRSADGAFSNQPGAASGSTPATAAAVTLTRYFGATPAPDAVRWLSARCHAQGGFVATPATPLPDLLSTATALHALVGSGASIESIKEPCLDFVDSLWTNRGSFYGHWSDDQLDCEYTFYGLLALGHLSL